MTVDFPCSALGGSTPTLTGGVSHTVSAQLLDSAGNVLSSVDPTTVGLGCGETDSLPPIDFAIATCDASPISANWTLTANGVTVSCAQAGATTVSIMVDDSTMVADFPCSALGGMTPAVTGGTTHSVSLVLTDSAGNVLSQVPATEVAVGCSTVTSLGQVEFSLTP